MSRDVSSPQHEPDVRPWVARLGSYLRIFGRPNDLHHFPPSNEETYLARLERLAKKREEEHGA